MSEANSTPLLDVQIKPGTVYNVYYFTCPCGRSSGSKREGEEKDLESLEHAVATMCTLGGWSHDREYGWLCRDCTRLIERCPRDQFRRILARKIIDGAK